MSHLSTIGPAIALRRAALVVMLALGAAGPARAQGPAGAVTEARVTLASRHDAVAALEVSRQALSSRSEALATEIARLKAAGGRPILVGVGGGALAERLQQHQALVGQLGQLDRQVEAARSAESEARQTLLAALETRIAELRAALAQGDEPARRARFEVLRTLVDERTRLAVAAAPAPAPAVELPAVDPTRVHPGELQDLADETRDQADHVRQALGQLEQRLGQLQSRRRMLRVDRAVKSDQALFGEDERVRRVVSVRSDSVGTADGRSLAPDKVLASGDGRTATGAESGGPTSGNSGPGAAAVGDDRGSQDAPAEPSNQPSDDGAGAAPPEAPGAEGDFAAGESATDGDMAGGADPSPAPPLEPAPPPQAVPGGVSGFEGNAGGVQPALTVQDTLDPQLLNTDVSGLGADALADQIRQLETRKRALQKTAQQLDQRRRALEQEAGEGGD